MGATYTWSEWQTGRREDLSKCPASLSYPDARLFSHAVGVAWMNVPLDFSYSAGGVALWLAAVTLLSALASLWPALRATRVSVRQALAYE